MPAMELSPFAIGGLFSGRYAGKRARLCAANNSGSLTLNSTTAQWDAAEISGNGYARVEWTIPAGSYNTTTERFEAPVYGAVFQASANGVGLAFNSLYLVIGTISNGVTTWNTEIEARLSESPSVALSPGEPRTYNVTLLTDGLLVTA